MFEDFKIKIFMTVAEEGSFTKAASAIGITQPAVSQNIAELERLAGTRLFLRERGSVTLTDHGRVLLKYASKLSSLGLAADRIFTSLPVANITVRTSDELWHYMICPALEDFSKIHENVNFIRTASEYADMTLSLIPSSLLGNGKDAIGKIRVSLSPIPSAADDYSFCREKSFTFELRMTPSPAFAGTPHYRLLCATLTDIISL